MCVCVCVVPGCVCVSVYECMCVCGLGCDVCVWLGVCTRVWHLYMICNVCTCVLYK